MKYGISLNVHETLQDIMDKSREIERLGFHYIWVADTPSQRYAPIVASAIAESTKRVKIGIGVLSPFLYSEREIANAVKTLIEFYGERFEVCLGPGDPDQLRRVGISLLKLRDIPMRILESKRKIEEEFDRSGLNVPIWIGAQGPRMLKISKFFQGVLLNYAHPELVRWATDVIKTSGGHVKLGVYASAYVYSEEEEEVKQLLRMAASTVVLGLSKNVLEKLGFHEEVENARVKLKEGLPPEDISRFLPEELLEKFIIHMPTTKLKEYLSALKSIGIEHLVFGFPQNFSKKNIRVLAEALF
ncbi:LLM class flavin-dependent oxidoreductase [Candidatus Bathyarchaeota archaeon]|nr:LLM class flavin-dependent oxidoreductase [Candidatus Bathyarchaeota archaeon]